MWQELLQQIQQDNHKALARAISLVENQYPGYEQFLQSLETTTVATITGITGAPGTGKSTLTDLLIGELVGAGKKVAVLCVDPSSPFHLGALLGDRIRMSEWYTHPSVFIRSLASRGSLGGLHPRIIEITDVLKAAGFDHIIVETVGVGQSEIEIAGLADTTVVVLVPEGGDEIQTMKAGLMEIADIFVVNKCDRPGADLFIRNLRLMLAPAFTSHAAEIAIVSTVATERKGIAELIGAIEAHHKLPGQRERRIWLLAEKAWQLIVSRRMKEISRQTLKTRLEAAINNKGFNLYSFVDQFK